MAWRLKAVPDASRDLISQLPLEVKDKILECLPTRDAARTALLSTHWKHVWLHHGRLVFDTHFLECLRKCEGDKLVGLINVINHILLNHASPVKKFSLCISCPELEGPNPQQSDIDCWCLYLSRNGVEELNITIFGEQYKLSSCIILCRTIKQLKLGGFKFDIDCPVNGAGCIFPGVTSLVFKDVEFKSRINGVVSNLEKLSFRFCVGITNFEQLKTLPDASRDLISKFPVEIKNRILECLTTRDAARTALLSTHWNDVWLQHEQLMFDYDFVQGYQQSQDVEGRTLVSIINNILFSRAGPVKKFTLEIDTENDPLPLPQQYDIDRWCLFLSTNGVEELNLSIYYQVEPYFQLPFCLLSCRTIKKLIVEGPDIDLPLSACGIFSNVTSLAFLNVAFDRNVNGIASSISIPKLEKLALEDCGGINMFEISSPKLEILSVIDSIYEFFHSRWLEPHLKAIRTLWLCGTSLTVRI
nr:F-box/FBD/LRR-repeat protein At1g13570-like [Ipomoea batatas]